MYWPEKKNKTWYLLPSHRYYDVVGQEEDDNDDDETRFDEPRSRPPPPKGRRRRQLFVLIAVIWVGASLFLKLKKNGISRAESLPESFLERHNSDAICSYEDLQKAFGTEVTTTQEDDGTQCWSLRQNILRVPLDAIVNRYDMPPLGNGNRGGIYKALIRLDEGSSDGEDDDKPITACWAAAKADICVPRFYQMFVGRKHIAEHKVNCLSDDTAVLWQDMSYMGGEYSGALPYALDKHSTGLLPTFGVITAKKHPLHRIPSSWVRGFAHPDRTVLGVIMPLRADFTPIKKVFDKRNVTNVFPDVHTTSSILLPAAQGLEYIHSLGFAHQDVSERNVALTWNKTKSMHDSFLLDFSSFAKVTECRNDDNNCGYCTDEYFSHKSLKEDPIDEDVRQMVRVVEIVTRTTNDVKTQTKFRKELFVCKSASDIVELLTKYSKRDG